MVIALSHGSNFMVLVQFAGFRCHLRIQLLKPMWELEMGTIRTVSWSELEKRDQEMEGGTGFLCCNHLTIFFLILDQYFVGF